MQLEYCLREPLSKFEGFLLQLHKREHLYCIYGAYDPFLYTISLSVPNGCNFTTNFGSMMSKYFLMNYSLSARIYPIVDFEVIGTLIYNGLSGFALKRL